MVSNDRVTVYSVSASDLSVPYAACRSTDGRRVLLLRTDATPDHIARGLHVAQNMERPHRDSPTDPH